MLKPKSARLYLVDLLTALYSGHIDFLSLNRTQNSLHCLQLQLPAVPGVISNGGEHSLSIQAHFM